MRTLTIILLFATLACKSQTTTESRQTAGLMFQKAGKQYYSGLVCTLAGAGVTIYASKQKDPNTLYILGGGLGVIGIIMQSAAWYNVIEAGRLMEKNNVTGSISPTGVYICKKF